MVHDKLAGTNWLTNAADAQPGMVVHKVAENGDVVQEGIEKTEFRDGSLRIETASGGTYTASEINDCEKLVVE